MWFTVTSLLIFVQSYKFMREMKLSAIRRHIMAIRCQIIAIHQLQLRYLSETTEIMYNG
jgi:hypothetical protein